MFIILQKNVLTDQILSSIAPRHSVCHSLCRYANRGDGHFPTRVYDQSGYGIQRLINVDVEQNHRIFHGNDAGKHDTQL